MAVYVDEARFYGYQPLQQYSGYWAHLFADSEEELRAFARSIGLRDRWIQHPGTPRVHYDVTPTKRAAAVKAGAVEVSLRAHLLKLRRAVRGAA